MDKKLAGLMSVFLLSFALFLSIVFLNTGLAKNTRATNNLKVSEENSFILGFPLEINNNDIKTSTLTIFIRDQDIKPLPERTVQLSTDIGEIQPSTVYTDNDGKAVATFRCTTPGGIQQGIAQIHAIIDNSVTLTKTVTIKCD